MGESESDLVKDIREKLTTIISSLDKCENNVSALKVPKFSEELSEFTQNAFELLESKLSQPIEDFGHKTFGILSKFNSEFEEKIISLQNSTKNKKQAIPNFFIEKTHKKQSAPISKLLYSKDFQTIYNIFLAILVNIGIAELARDILNTNNVVDPLGYTLFTKNFGKFDSVIKMWVFMFIFSFITPLLIQLQKKFSVNIWLLIFLHLSSLLSFGYFTVTQFLTIKFPIASSFIVLCEMIRIAMKMHSYFREKLLHGLGENRFSKFIPSYASNISISLIPTPNLNILDLNTELKRYTFYMFAPTLIYRDEYPHLDRSIRWKNLSVHLFDFFGSIIYTALIFKAFCVPEFQSASKNITDTQALLLSWSHAMLPGTMVFLLLFFAVMHSWFSIWAEILNFADRKFYDDWWNAKDFGTFYRKINVLIYEWLHTYIFIDLQRFSHELFGKNISRVIVFGLSGVVAEMVVDLSLGFFFPYIFLIIAAPGAFMISFNNKVSQFYNVLVWMFLIVIMGLIIMLYSLEYYYRIDQFDRRDFETYGNLAYFIPQWVYQLTINN